MALPTGLIPYMNEEGPSASPTIFDDTTRPQYAIGTPVRFKWLVPTGAGTSTFNLFMHGVSANNSGVDHQLIVVVDSSDWVADGSVVLIGGTWDIYYFDYTITSGIPGLYSICLNQNGRHYKEANGTSTQLLEADGVVYQHDGGFILNPTARTFYNAKPKRHELHARIAGRKGVYKDEAVVRGQIEAGLGIAIKKRLLDGTGVGYDDVLANQSNLVWECALEFGTDRVTALDLDNGDAGDWDSEDYAVLQRILFSDEFDWVYDNANTRVAPAPAVTWAQESIPVHFQWYLDGDGVAHFSARAAHTGLFAAHDDGAVRTIMTPGTNAPFSIGHLEFVDTADLAWTLTEGEWQGPLGWRRGIKIEANVNVPAFSYSWYAAAQTGTPIEVVDTETVTLLGINGVTTEVAPDGAGGVYWTIDRPLQIQNEGLDVDGEDTTLIDFPSNGDDGTDFSDELRVVVTSTGDQDREVRVYGRLPSEADTAPLFLSTWWYELYNGNNYAPHAMLDYNMEDSLALGGHRTILLSPYGPYDAGFALIDNWELTHEQNPKWTEDVLWIDIAEDPLGFNKAKIKPMRIEETGVYDLNFVTQGIKSLQTDCAQFMAPYKLIMIYCLRVKRGGATYTFRCNDNFVVLQPNYAGADSPQYLIYDSLPWSLQGTLRTYLEEGDLIWNVIHCHVVGVLAKQLIRPAYHFFEIKQVQNTAPTTNENPSDVVVFPPHNWQHFQF